MHLRSLVLRFGTSADPEECLELTTWISYDCLQDITIELELLWDSEVEGYSVRTLNHDAFMRYVPSTIHSIHLASIGLPQDTTLQLDAWSSLKSLELLSCRNVRSMLAVSLNTFLRGILNPNREVLQKLSTYGNLCKSECT